MNEDLQRAVYALGSLFSGMPPAVFVAASLALLCAALWLTHHVWRNVRIVSAVSSAPLADLRSTSGGLVKLRGKAQPAARPGRAPSNIVWFSRSSRSGSNSSTHTTTDNFMIEDEHGSCAVETAKAEIVPTSSVSGHAFLDQSRTSSEKVIYTGDPVFALGEIRRDLPALAGMPAATCRLVKVGGVLLVSGSSERGVKVLYILWTIVQTLVGLLCWVAVSFGIYAHLISYPPTDGSAIRTFFDTLRTTPLKSDPGFDHPGWDQNPPQ
jgi:hypothetical protein